VGVEMVGVEMEVVVKVVEVTEAVVAGKIEVAMVVVVVKNILLEVNKPAKEAAAAAVLAQMAYT
jgi:hypothetical protein